MPWPHVSRTRNGRFATYLAWVMYLPCKVTCDVGGLPAIVSTLLGSPCPAAKRKVTAVFQKVGHGHGAKLGKLESNLFSNMSGSQNFRSL